VLNVPDRLQAESGADDLTVSIKVSSMKDFNPASLVEQIPELKKLMELRNALMALKGPLGNMPSFRKAIEQVITDETSRKNVLDELGLDVAAQQ
ncbi:type VI secretion system contractile sheath small subunit, partial [Pseudomonas syringae]